MPLGGYGAGELHTSLVIAHDGFAAVLQDDVLVLAAHQMLVCRHAGGQEPPSRRAVFGLRLPVEGIHLAARAGHRSPVSGGHLPFVVVGHPRVDVAAFHADFPVALDVVPRKDAAESLLPLAVLEIGGIAVVGREHRKFPVGIDVPRIQTQFIAFAGIVIDLLKQMQVLERSAAVALLGVVLPDDVLLLVVDVYLLVVVGVFIIIR